MMCYFFHFDLQNDIMHHFLSSYLVFSLVLIFGLFWFYLLNQLAQQASKELAALALRVHYVNENEVIADLCFIDYFVW